jgi:hypothetical protein
MVFDRFHGATRELARRRIKVGADEACDVTMSHLRTRRRQRVMSFSASQLRAQEGEQILAAREKVLFWVLGRVGDPRPRRVDGSPTR